MADHVLGLLAGMATYDSAFDTGGLARTFGVELTTLESVARRIFAGPRG